MTLCKPIGFVLFLVAANSIVCAATPARKTWRVLPSHLWAQVVAVPSGTTGASRTDVLPGSTDPSAGSTPSTAPATPASAGEPGQPAGGFPSAPPPGVPTVAVPSASGVSTAPAGLTSGRLPQAQEPAPPPQLPPGCTVTLEIRDVSVSQAGGPVVFAPKFLPEQCATEPASTASWIQRASTNPKVAGYAFTVEPNRTRLQREGAIRVGTISMTVKQAAATFVPFAAAPGRVELVVGAKGHEKQTLTAWSDDATVKFEANTPTPWLKVTPVTKGGKAGARKFAIEVTPADLKPGVHQGSIEVTAPGAVNEPIQIPVVVTVPEKSK